MDKDKQQDTQRRTFIGKVKGVDSKKFIVDVIMSDASMDRYSEVIHPKAWAKRLGTYKKHPVLLSSHNYWDLTNQIGKAKKIGVNATGQLEAQMQYFVGKGNAEADWGFFLAEEGIAAYSVGFMPKAWLTKQDAEFEDTAKELGYKKKDIEKIRYIYTDVELLENSQVLVPANANALQKSLDSKEVQGDPILKDLYTQVIDKLDTFKDFFASDEAGIVMKGFSGKDSDKEDVAFGTEEFEKILGKVKNLNGTKEDIKEGAEDLANQIDKAALDSIDNQDSTDTIDKSANTLDTSEKDAGTADEDEEGVDSLDKEDKTGDIEDKETIPAIPFIDTAKAMAKLLASNADDIQTDYEKLAKQYKELDKEVPELKTYETMEDVATGCKDPHTGLCLIKELSGIKDEVNNEDILKRVDKTLEDTVKELKGLLKDAIGEIKTLSTTKLDSFESKLKALETTINDSEENKLEKGDIKTETEGQFSQILNGIKNLTSKTSKEGVAD